jgi:cysteine desulfurase/selenocysteine lyase
MGTSVSQIAALWREQALRSFTGSDAEIPALTLDAVAREFPIAGRRSYLNNASIGPMSDPVLAAVDAFLHDVRDNGRNNYPIWCSYADRFIKQRIARLIGARAGEIAFVKNTTEGLGIVANGLDWREGDNVVLADIEYPSNVYCWMRLARRGVDIRWVKAVEGRVPVDALRAAVNSRTRLISISAVQFSNGFRHDLAATSQLCAQHGILLNLDAIQWVGALQMDVSRYHVDFLSVGGHKWLLAPIGTGFFYCNAASLDRLDPPTVGYHSVDKGEAHMDYDLVYRPDAGRFEEALVNLPGIWGLDAAVKLQLGLGSAAIEAHILELGALAAELLLRQGWKIVSPLAASERSGNLCFTRPGLDPEAAATRLRDAGVDLAVRGGALRISPTYYNDARDIERLIDELKSVAPS